ncbi:MAG: hypothetical protein ACUVUC_14615 [Thermoguttaceae bacterium]
MRGKPVRCVGLLLAALVWPVVVMAQGLPPAVEWIPNTAAIVIEVSQPKSFLDLALSDRVVSLVTSSPVWKRLAAQPGFQQSQQFLKYLEGVLQADWQTGLRKLLGGGLTSATMADGSSVLLVDSEDARMLEKLCDILLGIAKVEAVKGGEADAVGSKEHRGVRQWMFGSQGAMARLENRLVLANRAEALRAVLDQRAQRRDSSVAGVAGFQDAKRAAGSPAALLYANLEIIKRLPAVRQGLDRSQDPMLALLLGAVQDALRESHWLALGLRVDQNTVVLEAVTDGRTADPAGPAGFTWPSGSQGALPNLDVPGRMAALSLYRDLHNFYAAKDKLFPERTSGLIFFENMMGIFFSGRDFTEEVLGQTEPHIRLVVAEQNYDPAVGTPRVRIPAFAAVFHLKNPRQFAEVAEEAFQKAVGLISVTSGQKAQPGLILDRSTHGDTRFTVAYFPAGGEKERENLPMRFNFRPALAIWGDQLILSSAEPLARDLIDAVKRQTAESVKALAQTHSLLELDLTRVASALGVNREALIQQNMLEKAASRQQAETNIDLLLTSLRLLGRATVEAGTRDGQARASLKLDLNL